MQGKAALTGQAATATADGRKYRAWCRHVTLAMLAHAFLAVTARDLRLGAQPPWPIPARGSDEGAPAKKGT